MPTIIFDAAHLADAVGKASKIAPTRGAGADQAAGLVFTASSSACQIKATDLELAYWQTIPVIGSKDMEGEKVVQWRLPSATISKLVNTFPLDQSLQVKLIDTGDGWLRLAAAKTKAKLPMIPIDSYPGVPPVTRDGMAEANEFASKIAQVSWATAKTEVLAGVRIDGDMLVATDRYVLATVPCKVPIMRPITVPVGSMATLIKNATDVKLRADERRLEMLLDAETEAVCPIMGEEYPNWQALGQYESDTVGTITFNKSSFLETLDRMLVVVATEKMPTVSLTVQALEGRPVELLLDIEQPELGRIQEAIDCTFMQSAGWDFAVPSEQLTFHVTPAYLKSAINACKSGRVNIAFGHRNPSLHFKVPIVVTDDTGYKAFVMSRNKGE